MENEGSSSPMPAFISAIIVVAIIGVLAAIAIPDFLKFGAKAPQSEAKTNLASIATSEIAYFAESSGWSDSYRTIGWSPDGRPKYVYFLSPTEYLGRPPEELGLTLPVNFSAFGAPVPGYDNGMIKDDTD